MKKISLLGATGSIGLQTLDIIKHHHERYSLVAMSVGQNIERALHIIGEFLPKLVCVQSEEGYRELKNRIPQGVELVFGQEGLLAVATFSEADILVNAVIGSIGLGPTLAAIEQKKTIAIANKETLVTAGHLVMELARKNGVPILPVDSEHSAIFQCLQGEDRLAVKKLILTASGGSFRNKKREELRDVTVEDALKHPNWSMGAKITIDSATMMNKGLEVIEAHWLFGIPYEQIEVLLHRESIVHSMVEFSDSSVIAQLGTPDMRVPIQYALTFPRRLEFPSEERLKLWEIGTLHFDKMDEERYPCIRYAFEAGKIGGTMPTVLNAANEVAVAAFLNREITFLDIETYIEKALSDHEVIATPTLEDILIVDQMTRERVRSQIS
ncbi:MAG TPA: 1-deoxy-D-xylulose-5-phosphate reductoisomerase [Bacilli bacterium]|nr:1-deoxy-D-xylulose-5-phosphate reductoisomerase [Bacilli bacterium]